MQDYTLPVFGTLITAVVTWFIARRKTNAEAKSAEIDAEIKAAKLYKSLLDDAMNRLDKAIATINKQEEKIKELIAEVEHLTEQLKKYKQLNGKA